LRIEVGNCLPGTDEFFSNELPLGIPQLYGIILFGQAEQLDGDEVCSWVGEYGDLGCVIEATHGCRSFIDGGCFGNCVYTAAFSETGVSWPYGVGVGGSPVSVYRSEVGIGA